LSCEITVPGRRPGRTIGKATRAKTLHSQYVSGPAESETLCMRGHSMFENRESSEASGIGVWTGSAGEGLWPKPRMYASEQSDTGIVPKKEPNKAACSPCRYGGSGEKAGDQGEGL